ncbi:retrotransposon protein, putative, ty1-copia subclass [Tanacetum coccineum]
MNTLRMQPEECLKLHEKAEYKIILMLGLFNDWKKVTCSQGCVETIFPVLEMKGFMDQLQALGKPYDNDMAINLINSAISVNGVFEIDMNDNVSKYNNNSIFSINKKRKLDLNSSYLWHCRLAHIGKTRMQKLQREVLLESINDDSYDNDKCESCISVKHVSRKGASYFLTFTDDFSRYGYVYLLKHKHEVFETFKVFKSEVELQLGKKIKALRSDRGGEYLSQEFKDYLEVEDDVVGDLGEPANYKAAMLDLDKVIWQSAMDEEMNSMKVNEVWTEVDPYSQMLSSKENEDIYMEQPEGYVNPKYPKRVCKLQRSIYGLKQASRQWNKRFDEEIKKFGFTQNHDEPCVYRKASGSNVVILESVLSMKDLGEACIHSGNRKYVAFCSKLVLVDINRNQGWLIGLLGSVIVWQSDKDDTKSQTGYVFVVNGGAVDWKSKKQTTIAMSATQAEYMAASEAVMEAVWIRKFVGDLGVMPSIKKAIIDCIVTILGVIEGVDIFAGRISLCSENKSRVVKSKY